MDAKWTRRGNPIGKTLSLQGNPECRHGPILDPICVDLLGFERWSSSGGRCRGEPPQENLEGTLRFDRPVDNLAIELVFNIGRRPNCNARLN